MANKVKSISFKNAIISVDDNCITEITKDDCTMYNLYQVLKEWSNIEGLSITIKQNYEVPSYEYNYVEDEENNENDDAEYTADVDNEEEDNG